MTRKCNLVLIIVLLLIITVSCKDKIIREFYDTGELLSEKQYINDSIITFKEYYKNGNLGSEGHFVQENDSSHLPIEHWKFYFSDGQLAWEGEFNRGEVVIPVDTPWLDLNPKTSTLNSYLQVERSPALKGEDCNFRIVMPQVHSDFYLVMDSNFEEIPRNADIQSAFRYTIKPEKSGDFLIQVIFRDKNGYFIVGERTIYFYIKIV
ncbi:MAG: hypothetical protein LBO74_02175 [Candidatus Symbiothrix sp.]|jgi:hypothetical protein|nr:hypothetical protein [Candidatus Symbiothrix sp.]